MLWLATYRLGDDEFRVHFNAPDEDEAEAHIAAIRATVELEGYAIEIDDLAERGRPVN